MQPWTERGTAGEVIVAAFGLVLVCSSNPAAIVFGSAIMACAGARWWFRVNSQSRGG